jgi:8-oxo-dGTP pyrophosphatase MutT (NUDIX family)
MKKFVSRLKNEILKGLPGTDIQWQMSSLPHHAKLSRVPGDDARIAAVLILLYPFKQSIYTVFMQRPDYKGIHGGQISFPGGKAEPGDEGVIQTALREANEETGVEPSQISVLGTLTPLFIPVSNMLVTPVVGWIEKRPLFKCQAEEVVFLIEADMRRLLEPAAIKLKPLEIRGDLLEVRYFDYTGNVIWGATAMIFNELLYLIRRGNCLLKG